MSTLTIRKPRKANLRNNMKIMAKPYHLVCKDHPEARITVHPPKSMKPGPVADGRFPKDEHGRWVRQFTIEDSNGIKQFQRKRFIHLVHFPGEHPYFVDEKNIKWVVEAIPDVHAVKARGKDRKGFRAMTTVTSSRAAKKAHPKVKAEKKVAPEAPAEAIPVQPVAVTPEPLPQVEPELLTIQPTMEEPKTTP